MKKVKVLLVVMALGISGIAKSQNCGQLVFGDLKKMNGQKICWADNTGRECVVVIDPCPIQ